MSFAEKLTSLMQRPNEDLVPKDEVPWWMKYAGRGCGTVGGGVAIFLGVWNCLGIIFGDLSCVFGGIWQMVAGFLVIVIEAPCCCFFIEYVQNVSDIVEKRPYWNKGALYCGIALPPFIFCIGLASFFGSGLIFLTGVIYGMMALGKKATAEEMRQNAASAPGIIPPPSQPAPFFSSGTRSNLVENAQPISFTGTPIPPV
ncbi:hypothetical protein LSTR_LSTR010435 [Laodelphax striatellus]|uniref:Calcium channel flower n=1 Tax=Laodelphax striatellus TaxID=195883 RepID=A0A482WL49_LAOST|nr:hypothetical protein LSTR_LSTR010435 [Laodelphax striatellus]